MKEKKKEILLRINPKLHGEIKKESERIGVSVHELIVKILNDKFNI